MLTEAVKAPLVDTASPVWFDGTLLPSGEARLHVLTHSLHNGGAVFEGIRAYDGRLFLGKEHFRRLQPSAELLGYTLPWLVDDLQAAAEAVLWAGGLRGSADRLARQRKRHRFGTGVPVPYRHRGLGLAGGDRPWRRDRRIAPGSLGLAAPRARYGADGVEMLGALHDRNLVAGRGRS